MIDFNLIFALHQFDYDSTTPKFKASLSGATTRTVVRILKRAMSDKKILRYHRIMGERLAKLASTNPKEYWRWLKFYTAHSKPLHIKMLGKVRLVAYAPDKDGRSNRGIPKKSKSFIT